MGQWTIITSVCDDKLAHLPHFHSQKYKHTHTLVLIQYTNISATRMSIHDDALGAKKPTNATSNVIDELN